MNRIGGGGKVFRLSGLPSLSQSRVMRSRPSARLLILDSQGRLLLFRFVFKEGPLAGQDYWATPGGGLENGETFEQAAIRELAEETGIEVQRVGSHIAEREFVLRIPSGEEVISQERFFLIDAGDAILTRDGWTADEVSVMAEHKWWTRDELAQTDEQVWPQDLLEMLAKAGR
jgi:8-oxo-dGTP pyrophosphatase MutT (NUDIX family)